LDTLPGQLRSRPALQAVLSAAGSAAASGVVGRPRSCCRSVLAVNQSPRAMPRLMSARTAANASGKLAGLLRSLVDARLRRAKREGVEPERDDGSMRAGCE